MCPPTPTDRSRPCFFFWRTCPPLQPRPPKIAHPTPAHHSRTQDGERGREKQHKKNIWQENAKIYTQNTHYTHNIYTYIRKNPKNRFFTTRRKPQPARGATGATGGATSPRLDRLPAGSTDQQGTQRKNAKNQGNRGNFPLARRKPQPARRTEYFFPFFHFLQKSLRSRKGNLK